jgi:hypothetical protein
MFPKKITIFALAIICSLVVCGGAWSAAFFPQAEGLDVDPVVSDPFAYKGEITVRGGVMNVEPGKNLFQIIDYREYRHCGIITCAAKWITVAFNGKLPAKENVVEVKGTIEKNESGQGGFILKASEVKVK